MRRLAPALAATFLLCLSGMEAAAREPSLAPHRAVYDLSLDPRRPARGVDAARGRIVFEASGDRCEGFSTSFRQVVEITTGGEQVTMDTRTANFEEGDGSAFRFTSQTLQNGDRKQEVDGSARRTGEEIAARVTKPQAGDATFAGGLVFPTAHLHRILETARRGDSVLQVGVYDGSETGLKAYDTTTIIGLPIRPGGEGLEEPARQAPLSELRRWPVTVSYFEKGKPEATPVYVVAFELFDNGVSRRLVIDYGDFTLRGQLSQLSFQPPSPCDK